MSTMRDFWGNWNSIMSKISSIISWGLVLLRGPTIGEILKLCPFWITEIIPLTEIENYYHQYLWHSLIVSYTSIIVALSNPNFVSIVGRGSTLVIPSFKQIVFYELRDKNYAFPIHFLCEGIIWISSFL